MDLLFLAAVLIFINASVALANQFQRLLAEGVEQRA